MPSCCPCCALQLGEGLAARSVTTVAEDVFFPTRAELDGRRDSSGALADRRRTWERQRRIVAPLDLGTPPKAIRSLVHGASEAARTKPVPPDAVLVGEPASPGRASGAVRIVRGPDAFGGFRDGEVLVARLTAPAWTLLFGRAAALVTDGGTLAAHTSLASTASPSGRDRGRDAQASRRATLTVDGSAGTVELDS